MTYQPTPAQLDGLVKCGAITEFPKQYGNKLEHFLIHIGDKTYRTSSEEDMIMFTARLKQFAIEKAKELKYCKCFEERTVVCEQKTQLEYSSYDTKDIRFYDGIWAVSSVKSVKIGNNWFEAVLAVCEVK